ncbi:GntR family transcriptional regulator [Nonomuraea purpurea]|uniref:GntR family transcriptional regulator n=1 Tax=Nonomuraea purpurea TaxID=1849276 RepID=A0ABV8G2B6_9ACTN
MADVHQMPDPRPAFTQIADDVREQIRQGELVVGMKLPALPILAERYGVAINTARAAVRVLVDEGLVHTQSTKGTFVLKVPGDPEPSPEVLEIQGYLRGLSAQMDALGQHFERLEHRVQELEARLRSSPERPHGVQEGGTGARTPEDGLTGD